MILWIPFHHQSLGHYVPQLAKRIQDYNNASSNPIINLKGFLVRIYSNHQFHSTTNNASFIVEKLKYDAKNIYKMVKSGLDSVKKSSIRFLSHTFLYHRAMQMEVSSFQVLWKLRRWDIVKSSRNVVTHLYIVKYHIFLITLLKHILIDLNHLFKIVNLS